MCVNCSESPESRPLQDEGVNTRILFILILAILMDKRGRNPNFFKFLSKYRAPHFV